MNPYLAKLQRLNSGKAACQATDKTDTTDPASGFVGFVGVQGYHVLENNVVPGAHPDARTHSPNISAQDPDIGAERLSPLHNQPWRQTEEERAAIIEYDGGAPKRWAEALARLDPARPPCDIPAKRWQQFIDDCGQFLDDGWATCAKRLGWGPLDLFGCDRTKPFARISRAGLLWLLNGRKLLVLSADEAAIATAGDYYLTVRRGARETGGVLAWELSGEADAP